jgi:hypothetical protein
MIRWGIGKSYDVNGGLIVDVPSKRGLSTRILNKTNKDDHCSCTYIKKKECLMIHGTNVLSLYVFMKGIEF